MSGRTGCVAGRCGNPGVGSYEAAAAGSRHGREEVQYTPDYGKEEMHELNGAEQVGEPDSLIALRSRPPVWQQCRDAYILCVSLPGRRWPDVQIHVQGRIGYTPLSHGNFMTRNT